MIENHSTLQYLAAIYPNQIISDKYVYVSNEVRNRNGQYIKERLAEVEAANFVHYQSASADPKAIKEVDFYMDNDLFMCFCAINQDRDYTGGGALGFSTDFLSMRWINPGMIRYLWEDKRKPHRTVLNYQSVYLGMSFFTPYIRYRDNITLADTLFTKDRPFGSYVYLSRSKYRLWPKGLIRNRGDFQIGIVGSDLGRDIQALLHRDATVESQKVYGWHRQIAQGGRWMIQLNQETDFLLYSSTNEFRSIFTPNSDRKNERDFGFNLIATTELRYGGFKTLAGGGLKMSTIDFTQQSGEKTLREFGSNLLDFAFSAEIGARYQYVIHNSMLEGFGYRRTYVDDEYDDDALSVYTLNQDHYAEKLEKVRSKEKNVYPRPAKEEDQVKRNLLLVDFRLNLRVRRTTFYWNMTFSRHECKAITKDYTPYESLLEDPLDQESIDFYNDDVVTELEDYRKRPFYGFGTIGLSWLVGE